MAQVPGAQQPAGPSLEVGCLSGAVPNRTELQALQLDTGSIFLWRLHKAKAMRVTHVGHSWPVPAPAVSWTPAAAPPGDYPSCA